MMLDAGDRVSIQTGGGGGYGDPRRRDRDRVRTDVSARLCLGGSGA